MTFPPSVATSSESARARRTRSPATSPTHDDVPPRAAETARRRATAPLLAASLTAGTLVVPGVASAHGLVGKQDLPVPQWLFAWAAGAVLVLSFIALALLWRHPLLQKLAGRPALTVPRFVEVIGGLFGIASFGGLIAAGLAGTQSDQNNIIATGIFVIFWVGVPFASVLFGDVFSLINPWRAIGRSAGWFLKIGDPPQPLAYPERLGRWPAAIGLLGFAWIELVYPDRDDPSKLAIAALVYTAVQLVGMSLYGEKTWLRNGDAFGVYFSFVGRLSPFQWSDGNLRVRRPLSGVTSIQMRPGTLALLCIGIGSTSFDGYSESTIWNSITKDLVPRLIDLGLNANQSIELVFTGGLLVAVGIISGLYWLGIKGVAAIDRTRSPGELAHLFAHSLVPILVAYVVAHYFSLLGYQGQAIVSLVSDPLGHGANLFGTAGTTINYSWISATGIWYVQVAALVVGHVAGLILAHDRAIFIYDNPRTAARSQYWMLSVMVCFTCLALYLLSAAAQ